MISALPRKSLSGKPVQALDKKLLRDFRRLWPQGIAAALVLACGVATLILAIGAYRSLEETRQAYYERYRFASVFAELTRAPLALERKISRIRGVLAVEPRLSALALLSIEDMQEPATGQVLSIPDQGPPKLNRLYLKAGRLPALERQNEVVISAEFAKEHGLRVGSTLSGTLAGRRFQFQVTGLALSPEFIYAIGPGDLVPDHRRFAVIWMRQAQLAGLLDLQGAFNTLSVLLLPKASSEAVIEQLDRLLAPYGGRAAYGRQEQSSHAFLDNELQQLRAMARVIPPIFLFVSAFLINMILSRLIALEREQIGLLKALGYGWWPIAWHYMKLVLVIAGLGVGLGFVAGTWLGHGLTRLYATFFNFPFLIFERSFNIYGFAALISLAAALLGALKAVWRAARLAPAEAMRPAAPPLYHKGRLFGNWPGVLLSQLSVMAFRYLLRWPLRTALAMLGMSLGVALLVTALFLYGSVNFMTDILFFQTDRQDATIAFKKPLSPSVMPSITALPGVLSVEPYRAMMATLSHGARSQRLIITGKPEKMRLSRILDLDLAPVSLPPSGLVLTERVADKLQARRGERIKVRLLEEDGREVSLTVVDIIQSYLGLGAYMELAALDRLSAHGPRRSGAYVELDRAYLKETYAAVKQTPQIASIALQSLSLEKFRQTIEKNITIMTSVYVVLAGIVAFGVVYNSARIQLSERARELASLRVLGFTRSEVSSVLMIELAAPALLAQPLGWALGYLFSWAMLKGFQNDLFRVPFVVEPPAFAWASLVVLGAAVLSAFIVIIRIRRLDMIGVLKTRE